MAVAKPTRACTLKERNGSVAGAHVTFAAAHRHQAGGGERHNICDNSQVMQPFMTHTIPLAVVLQERVAFQVASSQKLCEGVIVLHNDLRMSAWSPACENRDAGSFSSVFSAL